MVKLNMPIERPIVFFDVETTGVDVEKDRILELSALKFHPNGESEELYLLINPTVPISEEATSKHGFSNEDLKDKPKFNEVVDQILEFYDESDLGGHNSNHFDIQMLVAEIKRCGYTYDIEKVKMVDTRKIYLRNNPKELEHLYQEYTGKVLENAHSAKADIIATVEIFNAQVEKYGIENIDEADKIGKTDKKGNRYLDLDGKFIKTPEGKYLYNFGKHKDEEVSIHNVSFIGWMLSKDFSDNTKQVAKKLQDYVLKKAQRK
jgi:DNA polymerase-3 subunit epsilon